MKKILCLIFAVCLVLSLAACGGPKLTNADFEGIWRATADITEEITGSFSEEELSDAFGGINVSPYISVNDLKIPPLTVAMTLNSDGSFVMAMEDSCKQIIADAVVSWFTSSDTEGIYTEILQAQCAEKGISIDQLMARFGAEDMHELMEILFEMPLDKYTETVGQEMAEGMEESVDLSEFASSGTWKYTSGKVILTTDKGKDELAFDSNAFTLTEPGNGASYGDLVFSRG